MNIAMDTNQRVIPNPEPGIACGRAESGGYTVQPAEAGPDSTNSEATIIAAGIKHNQYELIFINPEAIPLAAICSGISKLPDVPLSPCVSTKNTIIVP